MGMKTKHPIVYEAGAMGGYFKTVIPAGVPVIPADNLPQPNDSGIEYWVEPWPDMTSKERSHMRTYGFGVDRNQVV